MMWCLKVEKGEPAGQVYELRDGEYTLGRSRSATCRLGATDVSGLHARLRVAQGVVTLENLSQFGTGVDGVMATAPVCLTAGQRLTLGKHTVLCLCQQDLAGRTGAASVASVGEAETPISANTGQTRYEELPTDEGGLVKPTPQAQPQEAPTGTGVTRGLPVTEMPLDNDADMTIGLPPMEMTIDGGTMEGATRAMQTRAASPEEIDHLREVEQKRHKRRMMRAVAVLIPLLILAVVFRPRTPPPEPTISWSKDVEGNYLDLFESAPTGGLADGGYDLCYPGPETFKKTVTDDGIILSGYVGRERNVPLRLIVQERVDPRFVAMSRSAFVEEWIQEQKAGTERWSFDKPSLLPGFVGLRNGLPYVRVTYYRDHEGSWFGVASVFRIGYRRILIRAEAPAAERVRVEGLLSSRFMRASEALEYSYWETPAELPKGDLARLVKQAEMDVNRMAPATWVELQKNLSGLLARTVQERNAAVEKQSLGLLIRLRERQALWFNSQQLAFDAARMQNNRAKAFETARLTKAVFNDMEDQRYYEVRKWNVEF